MRLLIVFLFGVAVAYTEDVVRRFGPAERMVPFICTLLGYWLGILQEATVPPPKKDLSV